MIKDVFRNAQIDWLASVKAVASIKPTAVCQHIITVRIGKSNLEKCQNPACQKVRYKEFEK